MPHVTFGSNMLGRLGRSKSQKVAQGKKALWATISGEVQQRSDFYLHLVGYALLLLALFDFAAILYPPDLTNPNWEFQTMGQLVERVPVPLLGFLLVFYRTQGQVNRREIHLLRLLSWLALLLGVLYLAMVPLGVLDTKRIYEQDKNQIREQVASQTDPIEQVESQLEQAQSRSQIQTILNAIIEQGEVQVQDPQQAKQQFLEQLKQRKQTLQQQGTQARQQRKQELLEQSAKWNAGALLSGFILVWTWRLTRWVRQLRFR